MAAQDNLPLANSSVDQSNASAGQDVIGRDKITNVQAPPRRLTKLEQLKMRLQQEVSDGCRVADIIEDLQRFHKKVPEDGITGVQAKLEHAGRGEQLFQALEMKEAFAKLLEKWSLYGSAQEIFAHLLAMADYKYNAQIYPRLVALNATELDELIEEKILVPAIEGVGADIFSMDHYSAMGMVYWLADQCRIRWHK